MEKLKFKHLDGVFGIFWFFANLKIRGFVFVGINLVGTIMAKHANIFGKLTLTSYFNFAIQLFNLTRIKEKTFLFMIKLTTQYIALCWEDQKAFLNWLSQYLSFLNFFWIHFARWKKIPSLVSILIFSIFFE